MAAAPAHPVHANIACLRIPRFESRSPAEQASLKEQLENRVLAATRDVAPADRVVLDTDDGLVLVLFCDAERALRIGQAVHGGADGFDVQVGLNYGPLALSGRGKDSRVFGDGISSAAVAARFAAAEKILVTESFARLLRDTSPEAARELADAGEFTDATVRQHAFFTPDTQLRALRQRRVALYATGGAIAILLLGVIGRDIYQPLFQSRPAIVKLEVKPRGEVFVDGISVGRTPPLTQIEVAPGTRKVQIRAPGYRSTEVVLELKPGERTTLTRTLVRNPEPPRQDLWRDLKKKFGS